MTSVLAGLGGRRGSNSASHPPSPNPELILLLIWLNSKLGGQRVAAWGAGRRAGTQGTVVVMRGLAGVGALRQHPNSMALKDEVGLGQWKVTG